MASGLTGAAADAAANKITIENYLKRAKDALRKRDDGTAESPALIEFDTIGSLLQKSLDQEAVLAVDVSVRNDLFDTLMKGLGKGLASADTLIPLLLEADPSLATKERIAELRYIRQWLKDPDRGVDNEQVRSEVDEILLSLLDHNDDLGIVGLKRKPLFVAAFEKRSG